MSLFSKLFKNSPMRKTFLGKQIIKGTEGLQKGELLGGLIHSKGLEHIGKGLDKTGILPRDTFGGGDAGAYDAARGGLGMTRFGGDTDFVPPGLGPGPSSDPSGDPSADGVTNAAVVDAAGPSMMLPPPDRNALRMKRWNDEGATGRAALAAKFGWGPDGPPGAAGGPGGTMGAMPGGMQAYLSHLANATGGGLQGMGSGRPPIPGVGDGLSTTIPDELRQAQPMPMPTVNPRALAVADRHSALMRRRTGGGGIRSLGVA